MGAPNRPEIYQVTLKLLVVSHEDPQVCPPQSWKLERLVKNAIELESCFVGMIPDPGYAVEEADNGIAKARGGE